MSGVQISISIQSLCSKALAETCVGLTWMLLFSQMSENRIILHFSYRRAVGKKEGKRKCLCIFCVFLFYFFFFLIVWGYFLFLIANNWAMYTEPVSRLLLCYLNIFLENKLRKLQSIEDCNLALSVFAYWKLSYERDFVFLTIYSCSGSDLMKMGGVGKGVVCFF